MNKKLIIGIILVLTILLIAIVGPFISPYDLQYTRQPGYIDGEFFAAPFPPSSHHIFGTDKYGHDMLTKVLHGLSYTVFTSIVVGVLRVFIGAFIGLFTGFRFKKREKSVIGIVWSAIPAFLISYFLLSPISVFPERETISIPLFIISVVLFIIIGIPSIASTIQEKTGILLQREYIYAAKVLGANRSRILYRHILPHLKETLMTLLVTEVTLVLTLLGQLGLFNVFLGGTKLYYDPIELTTISNEIGGLIGQMRMFIYSGRWQIVPQLFVFLFIILSFQTLSSGLNEYYQKKLHHHPFI